jgi:hypothetical protein
MLVVNVISNTFKSAVESARGRHCDKEVPSLDRDGGVSRADLAR